MITKRQAALLGALALVLLAGLLAAVVLVDQLRAALDPLERQGRAAELERQARVGEQLDRAGVSATVATFWLVLPLALAGAAGVVVLAIAYQRYGRPATIEARLSVEALRAIHQPGQAPLVPHHLSYSPRISGGAGTTAAALPLSAPLDQTAEPDAAPIGVPTFAQLLGDGLIGPGRPLVLGALAGRAVGEQLLRGGLETLYSTAIAGLPGAGKTTTQRFVAAQSALCGARFVVVDPQAQSGDESLAATLAPLAGSQLCEPAETERAILDAVRLVADLGERRATGRDADRRPVLLWCDEATGLLGHSAIGPQLARLLEQIAQRYRKVGIFASVSGQIWTASRTGGTELRDSLASVLVHRLKRSQARLLLPAGEAAAAERLGVGQVLLWRTGAAAVEPLTIPNTTAEDVRRAAQLVAGASATAAGGAAAAAATASAHAAAAASGAPAEAPQPDAGSVLEALLSSPPSAPGSPPALPANVARALALFDAGDELPKAIRAAFELDSSSGRAYTEARMQVETALRERLRSQTRK
ncbi:MAG TPA: type IV secretory system conjugative DNA transfer family protein [Roseiflexaceae bacterium]|nr:type IV secretory system conjugative DNA transfer family protein [Roseiflexaceae bacterium]